MHQWITKKERTTRLALSVYLFLFVRYHRQPPIKSLNKMTRRRPNGTRSGYAFLPLSPFFELRRNSFFFGKTIYAKKHFHFCQDSDGDGWTSFAQNFPSIYPSEECKFVLLKKNSRNEWAAASFFCHSEPSLAFTMNGAAFPFPFDISDDVHCACISELVNFVFTFRI